MSQEKSEVDRKKANLSVMTFWIFVLAVFGWVIPFTIIFVLKLAETYGDVGKAIMASIEPSLIPFAVTAVLCIIVYFIYRKLILKL